MKQPHPLYQKIIEELIHYDNREFQVPVQQRVVTAMNYLHDSSLKKDENESEFKI